MTNKILYTGLPPSPNASCSLTSSGENLDVTLQWSNSQYNVESLKYNVTVTPDPSFCSSAQVLPNQDYTCSGLDLGTNYSIKASSNTCGDQQGERISFAVNQEVIGKPMDSILFLQTMT